MWGPYIKIKFNQKPQMEIKTLPSQIMRSNKFNKGSFCKTPQSSSPLRKELSLTELNDETNIYNYNKIFSSDFVLTTPELTPESADLKSEPIFRDNNESKRYTASSQNSALKAAIYWSPSSGS